MNESVQRFYNAIQNKDALSQGDLIDLFVYYLTVEAGEPAATTPLVRECFEECDLQIPARIAAHLSEGVRKKPTKFVRKNGGYRLERAYKDQLSARLGAEQVVVQASIELRRLEASFPDGPEKAFLKETVDCFEAGANRAAIVMCWILTLDHLFQYILKNKLSDFNSALAKNTDKRVKVTAIISRDDFSEMPEEKFIEFCRSAKIISNDVRKILDHKRETRNSSAHPSGIEIKRSKVIEFIDDLVTNVVRKYTI